MIDPPAVTICSIDLAALDRLAEVMRAFLPHPSIIGLLGTLGAGKTTLVQAIARASGIDPVDVTSPTFTLLQSYKGEPSLHHLDAYRISDEDEFLAIGVDELFEDPQAWTIVEWADRVAGVMPDHTLWIEIAAESEPRFRVIPFQLDRSAHALRD